ncbi:MAG: Type 1 glutamine amidotransferase-like domain-containing protein [Defluviitaleaceae bacterium]|nr:Type 1 glutamine amidotransferase-like domain-containing protein [Defluviitaleaceae bacterium]
MSIQYYTGFFEAALPEQMAKLLCRDMVERKSIAVIAGFGKWLPNEDPRVDINFAKDVWLDSAGIVFDEYHLIDRNMPKEKAQALVRDASVILLQGGYTTLQSAFLTEYELAAPIKESSAAVVMGVSAGAKNIGAKFVCADSNGNAVDKNDIYNGLGLGNFCYEPYFSPDNDTLMNDELLPLSQTVDIYATTPESFIRVQDGEVLVFGDAYLISGGIICKVEKRSRK